jgi:hypothetical protein
MTPAPRAAAPAQPTPAPQTCAFPVGSAVCGDPATHELPAGAASNADPLPLCDTHARRFLGAAQVIR